MDVWATIAAERRALADQLETLTAEQWATPSLCRGWTVHDVAAHLVVPNKIGIRGFLPFFVKARGNFDRANILLTAKEAEQPSEQIVADLRRLADGRFAPPGLGPRAPLTDVLVHGEDIRVPLGLPDNRPVEPWRDVLAFITSAKGRRGFVPKGLPALTFHATDLGWTAGVGELVEGPASAIAIAILGRDARVDELGGPGAGQLRSWLAGLR